MKIPIAADTTNLYTKKITHPIIGSINMKFGVILLTAFQPKGTPASMYPHMTAAMNDELKPKLKPKINNTPAMIKLFLADDFAETLFDNKHCSQSIASKRSAHSLHNPFPQPWHCTMTSRSLCM